jgi:hypothetical protein
MKEQMRVQIKYREVEKTIEASVEDTWLLLEKFFNQFIPSFEVAKKLQINVDLERLSKEVEGLIGFSSEGSNILVPKNQLTDNETLSLMLLSSYLGYKLNFLNSDALSKEELTSRLGKTGKITSTRLGELVKSSWVTKTENETFRLTTFGISQIQKDLLPRVKSKTGQQEE